MPQKPNVHARISVIVPVYNAEKTLICCVDSILSQSYPALEVILVDDGSKDGSLGLCRDIARKDQRVTVITQANAGPAMARNAALNAMTGDFVMFVDSDDRLAPDACARMIEAIGETDLVIAHYYFEIGKASSDRGLLRGNRVLSENEFLLELMGRPGTFYFSALWNKLYRASAIRALGLRFDPFLSWGEDFAFNMQYDHAVESVALLDMPVYYYVKNASGTSIRSLLHLRRSCRIKARLYRYFKALFLEKGMYDSHRFLIQRYIYNVTFMD